MGKDYRPEFKITEDPFWDIYYATMHSLRVLGMVFPRRTRLELFRLYTDLCGRQWTDDVQQALDNLEQLTEMRRRGLEPEHKNGKYI